MTRVALIGIDGGSWNVIDKLVKEGYMKNLEYAIRHGTSAKLRSTIPPVTAPAWLTLATGLNPGKTGIIDFVKPHNQTIRFVNSEDYRGRAIWDYASVHDLKVAVLDYPMLFPAYPINGIMISTWGKKVSTYPENLIHEIEKLVGDYDIFVNYNLEKYNDIELFIQDLETAIRKKLTVAEHVLRIDKWDLFVDVHSWTDWTLHRMWHIIDPTHPTYPGDNEASRYWKKFAEFLQMLDEYIGKILDTFENVLIVSDHGFGPQWGVFNLAKWLEKNKFLKKK